MKFVQLGILAATEITTAFHYVVSTGLCPCPEAVKAKRLYWRDMIVNEIGPRAD